jgi:hypothetical protein
MIINVLYILYLLVILSSFYVDNIESFVQTAI